MSKTEPEGRAQISHVIGAVVGQSLPASYILGAVSNAFCLPAQGAGFNAPGAELPVYIHGILPSAVDRVIKRLVLDGFPPGIILF